VKFIFIIHSLGIGGMERVMALLLNEFAKKFDGQHELHLILIGRKRELLQQIPDDIIVHKPSWEFNNTFRLFSTLRTLFFLRKTLKKLKPDCVLSFGELWNNLVLLASLGLRLPVFVSDRSVPNKNLGLLHNFLRKTLYPTAEGFIAQTDKAAKIAQNSSWNSNISIIGNPIEPFNHSEVQRRNIVLSVGRLIPTKNIDRLMNMFIQVNHDENWKLLVVGGNAKRLNLLEEYKLWVRDNAKEKQIQLIGEQNNVKPFLAEASIFAFTSTSEGFPNALAEAMAAGCSCIAYDCIAGPSDIIDDGVNGFLIPEHDEELFKYRLHLLMNDKQLRDRFGRAAKEKMKKFEASAIAARFYKFITT
jgi:glycosyltransferase involved in cell wall biosynthesis